MLCALRDLSRRIIGQPIVPRVQSSLAAANRIIFIPPRIIIVGQLEQGCNGRGQALLFEGVCLDGWR